MVDVDLLTFLSDPEKYLEIEHLEACRRRADWRGRAGREAAASRLVLYNSVTQTFSSSFSDGDAGDPGDHDYHPASKGCLNSRGSLLLGRVTVSPFGNAVYTVTRVNRVCKRWDCPSCQKVKYRMLLERIQGGDLLRQAERLAEAGVKYAWKFITLSLPGAGYRSCHTPGQAVDDLRRNFNKLITAMRKRYGRFHYLAVVEPQRDGFPHIHMLMVGEGTIPKDILGWLRSTWRDKYSMGEIDVEAKVSVWDKEKRCYVRVAPSDPWHAVLYATKYMSKTFSQYGQGRRVFSYSQGALSDAPGAERGSSVAAGAPLFVAYSDDVADPRSGNSCEEFRTSLADEMIEYQGRVDGIPCKASHDVVQELKRKLPPGSLIPKRYTRKVPS